MADVTVANTSPGIAGKTLACHDADGSTTGLWTVASPLALKNGVAGPQTWRESVDGAGILNLLADGTGRGLSITPAGDLSEKGRPTPLGHWIDVPFTAADFTAVGGGTWTVAPGQVTTNRYTLMGKTLTWLLYLSPAGAVGGAVSALQVRLPGGLIAGPAGAGVTRVAQIYNAGGGPVEAIALAPGPGASAINIQKNDNTAWPPGSMPILLLTITLEIQ